MIIEEVKLKENFDYEYSKIRRLFWETLYKCLVFDSRPFSLTDSLTVWITDILTIPSGCHVIGTVTNL